MITKIKTSDMSRSAWLAERRKSIGGSVDFLRSFWRKLYDWL
jgi:predicted phage-related endonuclease